MSLNCNFCEELDKIKNYFISKLNFTNIDGKELYSDNSIEYELHLVNRDNNVHIDIVKHINDNDLDISLKGNSKYIDKYSLYIDYFLNRQKLIDANMDDFIEKIDKDVVDMKNNKS